MNSFVVHANIHRLQRMLESETDTAQRRLLLELLGAEEAKLAELHRS